MKHPPFLRTSALVVLLSAALSAQATILDFEDLVPDSQSSATYSTFGYSPMTHGYELSYVQPYFVAWKPVAVTYPQSANYANYTGSVALAMGDGNRPTSTTTLTQSNGGAFNLVSMDIARLTRQSYYANRATFTLTGRFATGGTISQTYVGLLDDALHTASFPGFTNLISLKLDQDNNATTMPQFDNIVVTPVPEPGTIAALGLGTLALLRRRRRF